METVWRHPEAPPQLKKRIVRCLIREVVVDIDADAGEIEVVVHWQGGVHTELRLPRRRRGQSTANPKEAVAAVRSLVRTCKDDMIAGVLNRNGLRTGRGNRWTRERVTSLRNWAGIPRHDPQARRTDGWMNLTEAAAELGVSPRTLRLAVERGDVAAEHPLPDGPWVFNRTALRDDGAVALAARARLRSAGLLALAFPKKPRVGGPRRLTNTLPPSSERPDRPATEGHRPTICRTPHPVQTLADSAVGLYCGAVSCFVALVERSLCWRRYRQGETSAGRKRGVRRNSGA